MKKGKILFEIFYNPLTTGFADGSKEKIIGEDVSSNDTEFTITVSYEPVKQVTIPWRVVWKVIHEVL